MKKLPFLLITYILMAISFAVLLLLPNVFPTDSISFFAEEQAIPFNTGWEYVSSDGTRTSVELPTTLDIPAGEECTIVGTLPMAQISGQTLLIRTTMQSLKVYINDELLYERGTDDNFLGKAYGSSWNDVRIPSSAAGAEIKLVFCSPYESSSGILNGIVRGSKTACLYSIFQANYFTLFAGLIIIVTSVLLFVYYIYFWRTLDKSKSRLYLSLFCFLIGIWVLGESKMLQFVIGNSTIVTKMSFLALMLFPIPFLLHLSSLFDEHFKHRYVYIGIFAFILNFIVCFILQMLDIVDFFESMISAQILIILCMGFALVSCIYEVVRYKNSRACPVLLGLVILSVCGLVELLMSFANIYERTSFVLSVGILAFTAIISSQALSDTKMLGSSVAEAKYYQALAYTDLLTGGKNRTAYFKDVQGVPEILKTGKRVWLAIFDINNLKTINDSVGHVKGDEAIKLAYRIIADSFKGDGSTCYRIGGDEFAVIAVASGYEGFSAMVDRFRTEIKNTDRRFGLEFQIAMGFDEYVNAAIDHERLYAIIDRKMYVNKMLIKSRGD